jgi:hypothetical protein
MLVSGRQERATTGLRSPLPLRGCAGGAAHVNRASKRPVRCSKQGLLFLKKLELPRSSHPCAGAGPGGGGAATPFASQGRKACFFEKQAAPARREAKTLDHFGFGLSGPARPSFAKVF